MKKLIVIPVIALLLAACGSSESPTFEEELNKSWDEMTSNEQATFCLGYTILPEDEFLAGAAERFGANDAPAAVAWAEKQCNS